MAKPGTPLSVSVREQIKKLTSYGMSRRTVARQLELAKRTVDKYAKKSSGKCSPETA